jgi:hypothetical protein
MIPITPNAPPADPSKFPLGRVVITANAARRLAWHALKDGLRRHEAGDWGDLDPPDIRSNEAALKHGGRLLSAYGQGDRRFWIITECDRSATTILLPDDY